MSLNPYLYDIILSLKSRVKYMSTNDLLRIVSNETKDSIDQISVVTPTIFASIFSEFAKKHDTVLENEEEVSSDLLQLECSSLTSMQESTSKNAHTLSKSTDKAITAIKDKDETTLNEVLKETQALRAEIEKLKESMYKDELTNVYNRKWLHDNCLDDKTNTFTDSGTLAIIDLNYFKIVNDTHGHVIGDKVLIFIANQLKLSKHEVIRYGGDEFIIMFPENETEATAKSTLCKIRDKVLSKKLKAHNTMFRTSFSIGTYSFKKGDDLAKTIAGADKKMYVDKQEIKKRITGIEV